MATVHRSVIFQNFFAFYFDKLAGLNFTGHFFGDQHSELRTPKSRLECKSPSSSKDTETVYINKTPVL